MMKRMRILLQHKETGLYFKDIDSWAGSSAEALDFVNSTAALEFCAANHLESLQVVLKFEEEHYAIVLPALAASDAPAEGPARSSRA
jgi:hypothetical protein